ncbi:DNA primase [Caldalkalibacillus uzonensis]|uniref:DNA primase n=1 Tax=Caldalkalibacillus uzonensis TaxID=353224 RepID=A0ABU0CTA7_9BACI|nr:DNA primase [Caldalkalibacillus uzonensis]MDQ0339652.1 DNA primase [Caldalkalibacillus uzonensis]
MYKPISEETIQHILSQVDLVELAGEYVQLKKSGKNFMGLCPFHSEKTPSFSVSPEKQVYHCFGCGAGGNAITFLMEIEGFTFGEAVRQLAEKAGVPVQISDTAPVQNKRKQEEKTWMLKAHRLMAQLYHHILLERKEGQEALRYLQQRGFNEETIKTFQLGYAPDSWDFVTRFLAKRNFPLPLMEKAGLLAKGEGGDRYFDRFRGRVMFPIWDNQGQVIGFGGRLIGEGHPKYLNSPETLIFHKSKQLFNFHRARQNMRQHQTAVLFEGYGDVLSAYQAGILYATATLGTALSEDQARLLRRNAEKVIICYDGDEAGMNAAVRAAEELHQQGCLVKVATVPDDLDPDDYIQTFGAEAFRRQVLDQAQSLTAFQLERLKKGRRLSDDGERMAYIQDALRVISRLRRAVERDHYLRQLADEFSLSLDALKREQYQLYKQERRRQQEQGKQNQEAVQRASVLPAATKLQPAYINAERLLLAYMLQSKETAKEVEQLVGSRFNQEEHQRLAAYLYAFYADGQEADVRLFISTLDDRELIQLASHLSSMTLSPELSSQELQDYVQQVLRYPYLKQLEQKEEEKKKAERQGDVLEAARIAMEIIEMKKQLNHLVPSHDTHTSWKEGE